MKESDYYLKLPSIQVAAELETDPESGLSLEEAKKRLLKFGPNEIPEKEQPLWRRLLKRFWGPIPWMIEAAALLAAAVEHWEEFYIILAMLMVNAFLDFYQESKALNAIRVLKEKLAKKATVLREGKWQTIRASELVPGDILKIKIGDIVPADIKIIDAGDYSLIDQSALTGESMPVVKKEGDIAYSNSIVKRGEMVGIVVNTGLNTYFGKTVSLVAKAQREQKSHFQRMVIRVGDFLIIVTLVMISVILVFGLKRGENPYELLVFSLVLTVSAIPVALPTVLTVTMAVGALNLSRKKAIVSRLAAIEELAGMDILCSDKTGTLTKNVMTIAEPFLARNRKKSELFLYAILSSKRENEDPIEKPIFEYSDRHGITPLAKNFRLFKFIPFDPVRKRSEALVKRGDKECLHVVKGAPQIVLSLSDQNEIDKKTVLKQIEEFAQNGFRTLGVAFKKCEEESFHFVGLIPLYDPPREDSKEAVAEAKKKGVKVKMVTGDNLAVAKYIAKILDIGEKILDIQELKGENTKEYEILAEVISKAILKTADPEMDKEHLERIVEKIVDEVKKELAEKALVHGTIKKHESEIMALIEEADGFAQVYPQDKYFIVDELQKADHIVGMTGDGVNDAPALKKADTGIAVSGATDAARAAADIILLSAGLKVIVEAIKEARITFERMKSYTIFRIAETIRIIIFMTLSIVVFNFYPLTSVMIIVLALLNDIPILAIAYDNTKIRKLPVRWDMHEMLVLSSWLGLAGVLSSFTIFYIVMIYLKTHPESAQLLPHVPAWVNMDLQSSWHSFVQSLFFAKMVIAGHGTIYNTRIDDWFWKKPWPSPVLFGATFITRVIGTLIAVYGFGLMTPIGWEWAIFMWVYAALWFVFNDLVKVAVLRYYRRSKGIEVL